MTLLSLRRFLSAPPILGLSMTLLSALFFGSWLDVHQDMAIALPLFLFLAFIQLLLFWQYGHIPLLEKEHTIRGLEYRLAHRLEVELEKEKLFEMLSEGTASWEVWLSSEGRVQWTNRGGQPILGYGVQEVLMLEDFPACLCAEAQTRLHFHSIFRNARMEGFSGQEETFLAQHRDRSLVWLTVSWECLEDPNNTHFSVRISLRDTSRQQRNQAELDKALEELETAHQLNENYLRQALQEKARLSALLSAMNFGLLLVNNDNRVIYHNPALIDLCLMDEPIMGKRLTEAWEQARNFSAEEVAFTTHLMRTGNVGLVSVVQNELNLNDGRIVTQQTFPVLDENDLQIGRIWMYEDVTEDRAQAQKLVQLAEQDPLTGLFNRYRFQIELTQALAECDEQKTKTALLFFDLDEFKFINDTFGHGVGDQALLRVADSVKPLLTEHTVLARLGGDEFAILLKETDEATATAFAETLVQTISGIHFSAGEGHLVHLASSLGVALYPDQAGTPEELVARADSAMYQAKEAGKRTWRLYRPDHDVASVMIARHTWNERIQHALDHDLLELHFQGVYHIDTRDISHLEALIRMRDRDHPERLVPPGQFIPQAEKSGKILAIDRWVIDQSIALLAHYPTMPSISINISGRSFDEADLPDYIAAQLTEKGVQAERLLIELTETAAISDMQDAVRFIDSLRATGCPVCLDDFGNGFSSFAYLKHLKVDVLKLDGIFIRDLVHDQDSQIFVSGMVAMAHSLGKVTIAEFVEDEATLEMLDRYGVDMAQGYYLDRPMRLHPAVK